MFYWAQSLSFSFDLLIFIFIVIIFFSFFVMTLLAFFRNNRSSKFSLVCLGWYFLHVFCTVSLYWKHFVAVVSKAWKTCMDGYEAYVSQAPWGKYDLYGCNVIKSRFQVDQLLCIFITFIFIFFNIMQLLLLGIRIIWVKYNMLHQSITNFTNAYFRF